MAVDARLAFTRKNDRTKVYWERYAMVIDGISRRSIRFVPACVGGVPVAGALRSPDRIWHPDEKSGNVVKENFKCFCDEVAAMPVELTRVKAIWPVHYNTQRKAYYHTGVDRPHGSDC